MVLIQNSPSVNSCSSYALEIICFISDTINSLCYPFPEHRQYVFSLTTHTGDTYCLQALNQSDMDHWIRCIHSNCLEKIHLHSLQSTLKQSENDIIYENKILKLAELQLKLTTNENTRSIISKQIQLLERNLENLHCELFRQKCYLSAFDDQSRLPNAKELLAQISPTTKMILYNLHAFTPAAVYAYVISRERLECQKSQTNISLDQMEINQTVLFDSNPQRVCEDQRSNCQMIRFFSCKKSLFTSIQTVPLENY